ncbi:YihY/virulence factor BrkB family protein [Halobacteriovorax sp.]|uniref:YihY/virulence factor BrkB family protein n=1 Tax=Halobacteriovorax sp. TaxID=2020862 RepID=UPI00356390D6
MKKAKHQIIQFSRNYESYSYRLTTKVVAKMLHGLFLFKKRKCEILAGATTFFALLSFCPAMLLFISLIGFLTGDVAGAKSIVLNTVNENIPSLAPWILKSISAIVDQQLHTTKSSNIFNILFLGYSLVGLISALMYGIRTIAGSRASGGYLVEDAKSFLIGTFMAGFFGFLFISSNEVLFKAVFFSGSSELPSIARTIFNFQILPIISSVIFFTAFYKFSSGKKISLANALLGACSFVALFILGKSGHWIYVQTSKQDLAHNYGNFSSMVMAVVWIYYLVCSFFYGASLSNIEKENVFSIVETKEVANEGPDGPPAIPDEEELFKTVS